MSASTQKRPRSCKIHGDQAEGAAFAFRVRDPLLGRERHAERCPARDGDIKRRTFWREERSCWSWIELKSRTELRLRDAGAVDCTEGHRLPANQASGRGARRPGHTWGFVCCMSGCHRGCQSAA